MIPPIRIIEEPKMPSMGQTKAGGCYQREITPGQPLLLSTAYTYCGILIWSVYAYFYKINTFRQINLPDKGPFYTIILRYFCLVARPPRICLSDLFVISIS
jgi:hypothetical protein